MKRYVAPFYIIFFSSFLSPILDFPLYLAEVDIVWLSKVPLVSLFLLALVFHLTRPIKVSGESILFAFAGSLALIIGIFEYQFTRPAFLTHFYASLMPIISISFGRHFCKFCDSEVLNSFGRLMEKIFYLQVFILLAYFYFYYIQGTWSYFGFGTGIGLASIYMLSVQKKYSFLLGVFFDLLSGKRSGFIAVISVTVLYYLRRPQNSRFIIGASFFLLALMLLMLKDVGVFRDIFRRFELIADFDISDATAIFISTGGRLTEVFSIIDFLDERSYRWFIGSGMGAQYLFFDPRDGFQPELFHYAHFSPFGYIFLFGVPFTVLFYCFLFVRVLRGQILVGNFFYLGFLFLIITSFFGSNLFIDPRIWFFYGFVIQLVQDKRFFV